MITKAKTEKSGKISLKFDWSKISLRKVNWTTILAVLAYFHILVLFPLLFGRKSPFVQYHVRQGIGLLFVWVIFSFSFYVSILPWLIALYILLCIVLGVINVIRGREKALPLIGQFVK